jgi:Flp pilus assembly protein TadD
LGTTLKELGRPGEAEASYRKAVAIKPDFAEAHSNLGIALQELGRLEEAKASYSKAISVNPDYAEAYSNLGITLKELGRLQDAETSYKKAIAIKPDFAEAHSNLGITLEELGRLEDAETSYKKAIAFKPELLEAFSNLSLTLLFLDKLNEASQVLLKIIEMDPEGYGLNASVNLAILNFLNGNRSSSKSLLLKSTQILDNKKPSFKNEAAYWSYLSILLNTKQKEIQKEIQKDIDKPDIQKLYVIGDSHSLASHETYIKIIQSYYLCHSFWIVGCKQWHLGNTLENKYKHKFQKIIQCIPSHSNILLSIGEIDCRIDSGILNYIKKYPDKDKSELIMSTINGYLKYIFKLLTPNSHNITIQGVPCPNISVGIENKENFLNLIELLKEFNFFLKKQSHFYGFNFLDLYKLTDRGDGFSNGKWHIDQHHLSPAGMQEAWLTCFIPYSDLKEY